MNSKSTRHGYHASTIGLGVCITCQVQTASLVAHTEIDLKGRFILICIQQRNNVNMNRHAFFLNIKKLPLIFYFATVNLPIFFHSYTQKHIFMGAPLSLTTSFCTYLQPLLDKMKFTGNNNIFKMVNNSNFEHMCEKNCRG